MKITFSYKDAQQLIASTIKIYNDSYISYQDITIEPSTDSKITIAQDDSIPTTSEIMEANKNIQKKRFYVREVNPGKEYRVVISETGNELLLSFSSIRIAEEYIIHNGGTVVMNP